MIDILNKILQQIINLYNGNNPPVQNFRTITANATGEVVKSTLGRVYRINVVSAAASITYIKLYNKATAPTASDTPTATYAISAAAVGATITHSFVIPDYYSIGIGVRAVTGVADNDNTSPGTAPIIEIRYV